MTIEQSTLNAVCGDTIKYNSILKTTRESHIVKLRWEVFVILTAQNYTTKQIAAFFNTTVGSVNHGLRKMLKNQNTDTLQPITATLMRELCKSIPKENTGLLIEALRKGQYSFVEIGKWFSIDQKKARNLMIKQIKIKELAEFQERRKRIIKF